MTNPNLEERAIRYAMGVLRRAKDWQEAQHALADHPVFGPWLGDEDDDAIGRCQSIIREAEDRLGNALPY